MSKIDMSAANASLEQVNAGLDGVLQLLELQCERSEASFNVFCLLGLLKAQLDSVLDEAGLAT